MRRIIWLTFGLILGLLTSVLILAVTRFYSNVDGGSEDLRAIAELVVDRNFSSSNLPPTYYVGAPWDTEIREALSKRFKGTEFKPIHEKPKTAINCSVPLCGQSEYNFLIYTVNFPIWHIATLYTGGLGGSENITLAKINGKWHIFFSFGTAY